MHRSGLRVGKRVPQRAPMPSRALPVLPALFTLALAGCASPAAEPAGLENDPTTFAPDLTEDELRSAPKYTLRTAAIFGAYHSDEGCPGGFSECYDVTVSKKGSGVEVTLGDQYGSVTASAWASNGVLLFRAKDLRGDCDDPGCGNLLEVHGVLYPKKVGSAWVPQVKVTYLAEFNFPDEEGAPEGEVKTVVRMTKKP